MKLKETQLLKFRLSKLIYIFGFPVLEIKCLNAYQVVRRTLIFLTKQIKYLKNRRIKQRCCRDTRRNLRPTWTGKDIFIYIWKMKGNLMIWTYRLLPISRAIAGSKALQKEKKIFTFSSNFSRKKWHNLAKGLKSSSIPYALGTTNLSGPSWLNLKESLF